MQFKTPRIRREYEELENRNLKEVLLQVEAICDRLGIPEPILTCILRTPEENIACGGIPNSPHLLGNAADLRSSVYKQDEIQDLLKEVNMLPYKYHNKPTMLHHKVVGGVSHLHLQVLPEGSK